MIIPWAQIFPRGLQYDITDGEMVDDDGNRKKNTAIRTSIIVVYNVHGQISLCVRIYYTGRARGLHPGRSKAKGILLITINCRQFRRPNYYKRFFFSPFCAFPPRLLVIPRIYYNTITVLTTNRDATPPPIHDNY